MTQTTTSALAAAARAAGLAPSVHNTQPWQWLVHPDRLALYAVPHRQLRAADQEGRLLTLSCGTALHHARVALAAEGWQPRVERTPPKVAVEPGSDPDTTLLAQLWPQDRTDVTADAVRLYQAAQRRRTDRRPVSDQPVSQTALAAIRGAVESEHTHLHFLREEQISELAVAAARAEEQIGAAEEATAELAYWSGSSRPAGTGVPDEALPTQPPRTHVPVRDFGHPGTLPPGEGGDRAATYAVLFGPEDTPAGWLRGGEALSAAWLTAVDHHAAVLPFSAVVEAATPRTVLRQLLAGVGHPYLVLRIGVPYPDDPGPPPTERLATEQTVRFAEEAS